MKKNIIKTILVGLLLTSGVQADPGRHAQHKNNPHSHSRIQPAPGRHAAKIAPLTDADFHNPSPEKVELGKFLFYDKIISGNKNISCATCHHPTLGTGDMLSLPVGEGGEGLGGARNTGTGADAIHERVPRNAPHLFNLGAKQFTIQFHDGRVSKNDEHPAGFDSPAGDDLLPGLDHAVAVQAMFPPTSSAEMAGQPGENPVADAAAVGDVRTVWSLLTERVMAIDEYWNLIQAAYPGIEEDDVTFVHIANAIGAYEAVTFRADNSPFDRFLRGDKRALSKSAKKGFRIFRKKGNCISCHSGPLLTDHGFHAIGIPQIGPGKGDGLQGHDDFGRVRVTGDIDDHRRFRTPSLRNVALTGPWGHDGAYSTLEAVVRHHLNPERSLDEYDINQALLPSRSDLDVIDRLVYDDQDSFDDLKASIEIQPVRLSRKKVQHLLDFLHALTDPSSVDMSSIVPNRVPSGLPVAD